MYRFMMDRLGVVHYVLVEDEEIKNCSTIYWWERSLISKRLLSRLKKVKGRWI